MPGWEGSTRRQTLPANWYREIRPAVIARDRSCRWPTPGGGVCGDPGANQVDHIGDRDDHSLGNLQLLCEAHHRFKSAQQGGLAGGRIGRPRGKHPGML